MILLDTETGDPDDLLVLAYLADKGLGAITLHPGSDEQVGLIRAMLREIGLSIPVGGTGSQKNCVSGFYHKIYKFHPEKPDGNCQDIIKDALSKDATILTCGIPKNIDGIHLKEWWAQGAYAPHALMPENQRLEKFKDVEVCQSFNFSNRRLIQRCISNSTRRHFISKNICHGAIFDKTKTSHNPVIQRIMDVYLREHEGKALHDLLAAFAMINPDAIDWAEVEIYYDQNKVGSRPMPKTNTFISTGYDAEKFWKSI